MKTGNFRKVGRTGVFNKWSKHLKKYSQRASNKFIRHTFNKRKITNKDW